MAFHKCKSYLLCLEFADKILIFAVLERRLLQWRETEISFCFYNTMYRPISKRSGVDHTVLSANTPCRLSLVSVHQMALPITRVEDIQLQLTTHLSTRRDERLGCPGWLTYSGRFTHISGHLSATAGRAQDREPGKVRRPKTDVLPLCHATNCSCFAHLV